MLNQTRTKPMEVLLVEDGLMDARVTIHALRRSGVYHRLTLVRRVDEAIQFLNRETIFARAPRPDLLLLDVNLPDGTGIDVLDAISSQPKITTVMLTASDDDEVRKRCEEYSVNDYITKPVDEEKFLRVVREHKRSMVHSTPVLTPAL